jgi:ACS family tartrate transporter-like MFS transporter
MTVELSDDRRMEAAVLRRISYRLLPFLMLAYLIAFIDRVNVGFAALQMNKAIGLSQSVFGLGGGIFFIGYFFFEVPSNLCLERFGASRWIARIMISWGIVSAATAFVVGPNSFLTLRFLLGAAEAGFFPGVILYLTYWFPAAYRARIVGIFMVAIPISSFIGSPISGAVLGLGGMLGLAGWQWVFLIEALPAILVGFVCIFWLTDRPEHARWLTSEQRAWLTGQLASERARVSKVEQLSVWRVMRNKYVLILALVYAGSSTASSALSVWQPQIIKSFGLTDFQTGLVNAIPFGVASVLMVMWGRRSDRTGERVWHNALALMAIVVGLTCTIVFTSLIPTVLLLTLAISGTYAAKGPFWALSTEWLSAPTAAAGIAQINALGTVSGFLGLYLLGVIKDATGSYPLALLPIVTLAVLAAGAMLLVGQGQPRSVAVAR